MQHDLSAICLSVCTATMSRDPNTKWSQNDGPGLEWGMKPSFAASEQLPQVLYCWPIDQSIARNPSTANTKAFSSQTPILLSLATHSMHAYSLPKQCLHTGCIAQAALADPKSAIANAHATSLTSCLPAVSWIHGVELTKFSTDTRQQPECVW